MFLRRLRNFMYSRESKENKVVTIDLKHYNTFEMNNFIYENEDVVFCFRLYKQVFTPHEVEKAYSDESIFEETIYGHITGAVDLGYDFLMEVKVLNVDADGFIEETNKTEYVHLGQCRMTVYENLEEGVE